MARPAPTYPTWDEVPAGVCVAVDSAPWIYLLDDNAAFLPRFIGLFQAADAGRLQLALSAITVAEVLTGPLKAGNALLARQYEAALRQHRIIDIDAQIAALAAQLRATRGLKLPDALQLACALSAGCAVFATHDRDFGQVAGIEVMDGG